MEKETIWIEKYPDGVNIRFDQSVSPQRITIQKEGESPVHLDFEHGFKYKDICRARAVAKESFKLQTS